MTALDLGLYIIVGLTILIGVGGFIYVAFRDDEKD